MWFAGLCDIVSGGANGEVWVWRVKGPGGKGKGKWAPVKFTPQVK